jgi:hypothetical protein
MRARTRRAPTRGSFFQEALMHYANGREAKVGDYVVGKTYNQPDVVAGTLVSLTPGPDNCSAQVEYERAVVLDEGETAEQAMMRAWTVLNRVAQGDLTLRRTEAHGERGRPAIIVRCRDYTHAGNLVHADDARQALLVDKPALNAKIDEFLAPRPAGVGG